MAALQEVKKASLSIRLEPVRHDSQTLENWVTWMNDPDIRKWMYNDLPHSTEEIGTWLENATTDPRRHYFSLFDGDRMVGFVSLRQDTAPTTTGEIGIVIGKKDDQSRGIGSSAIKKILSYAKNDVHLTSVRAMIKPTNEKSIRLFTGAGFSQTGDATINSAQFLRFEKILRTETPKQREARMLYEEIGLVSPTADELGAAAIEFTRQLTSGGIKNDETSSLMMIDTLLSPPNPEILQQHIGKHTIVVEYGGTNVRLAVGTIGPDGQPKIVIDSDGKPQKIEGALSKLHFDTPEDLFSELFRVIDANPTILPKDIPDSFGLIWSFPGYAERTTQGIDVRSENSLTKGIVVSGLKDVAVGHAMATALFKKYYPQSTTDSMRVAVLNDTPAVLFSYVPDKKGVNQIGVVDGTGFNIAINVGGKTYNLEAGGFTGLPLPQYAESLEHTYDDAGRNLTEKQCAGKFVGDQFNSIVETLIDRGIIEGKKTQKLAGPDMDQILMGNGRPVSDKLGRELTDEELTIIAEAAARLRNRAAMVVGLLVGAVVRRHSEGFDDRVSIPVEGSFFIKTPGLSEIATVIASVVGGKEVEFLPGVSLGIQGAVAAANSVS